MKSILLIVAAILFICPTSHSAMKALSNESLSRVKGSDDKPSTSGPAAEATQAFTGAEQTGSLAPHPSLDCRLKELHESNEYKQFDFYLTKLEQFSDEQDYPHLAKSDKFRFYSSCFAETAKKCREKLAQLIDPDHRNNLAPMLNERHIIFCKADDFYNHLLRFQKGSAPLPDLNALISDIKACQRNFESLRSNLNCESSKN